MVSFEYEIEKSIKRFYSPDIQTKWKAAILVDFKESSPKLIDKYAIFILKHR